jgi:hypothetical protein
MRSTFFITGCFVLVTVASYCVTEAWGQANCNQNCKNVNQTGIGQPTITCWQYMNSGTSCWVCGQNSPGAGFCVNGDPNLVCVDKNTTINYQLCKKCALACGLATQGFQEASCLNGGVMPTIYQEELYLCDVPC